MTTPEDVLEDFEERVAIMTDGGPVEDEAIFRLAWALMVKRYGVALAQQARAMWGKQ